MNFKNFTTEVFRYFDSLSVDFGSGNVVSDFLLVIFALIIFLVLMYIVSRLLGSGVREPVGFERNNAMFGRLEKIEMNLNGFKTDMMRSSQLLSADLGYLKQELREIHAALGGAHSLDLPPMPETEVQPIAGLEQEDFEKKN